MERFSFATNQYPQCLIPAASFAVGTAIIGFSLTMLVAAQIGKPIPPQTPENEAKAESILKRAVESMGGARYLNVHSVIGRGLFTQYKDGKPGLPSTFMDYVVFPDHERTEFRGGGNHVIQTNIGDKGWLYDRATRMINDMGAQQISDFHQALRTSTDSLVRGWWQKEGGRLSYAGRREAGVGRHNEAVRLLYADGFAVEFEFGARDGLPARISYTKTNADDQEALEEDRLLKPIMINGITAPFVVDHYRAGIQISRVSYDSIEYNPQIPDSLFARPSNPKTLK